MNQSHDEDGSEGTEWEYREPDGNGRERVSDVPSDEDSVDQRVALSKYIPVVKYDPEEKSLSVTTRL